MGDAAEGLIDADARIQERMDELAIERARSKSATAVDPERLRLIESLRLARTELERQFAATPHERRRTQLRQAIEELTRRMAEASAAS